MRSAADNLLRKSRRKSDDLRLLKAELRSKRTMLRDVRRHLRHLRHRHDGLKTSDEKLNHLVRSSNKTSHDDKNKALRLAKEVAQETAEATALRAKVDAMLHNAREKVSAARAKVRAASAAASAAETPAEIAAATASLKATKSEREKVEEASEMAHRAARKMRRDARRKRRHAAAKKAEATVLRGEAKSEAIVGASADLRLTDVDDKFQHSQALVHKHSAVTSHVQNRVNRLREQRAEDTKVFLADRAEAQKLKGKAHGLRRKRKSMEEEVRADTKMADSEQRRSIVLGNRARRTLRRAKKSEREALVAAEVQAGEDVKRD